MTELDLWLKNATRHLSRESAAIVRNEIQEHYEASRDAAIRSGSTAAEAERLAVAALGDARVANRQYRRVLLTSGEASMLRQSNWEAGVVCSLQWVKLLLLAIPAAALVVGLVLLWTGATDVGRVMLGGGMGVGLFFVAPFLPIYTVSRARVFRFVKWIVLAAALVVALGTDTLRQAWLLLSCGWTLGWVEWTRASIRRKLPVARWPKQLYL